MLIKRTCKRYEEVIIMSIEDVKTSFNMYIKDKFQVHGIIKKLTDFETYENYLHIYQPLDLEQMTTEQKKELQKLVLKQNGWTETDIKNIL